MKGKLSKSKINEVIEEKELAKSDPRFAQVFKDPRFKNHQRKQDKVLLDDRFQSIVDDNDFYKKGTMHPRGKKEFHKKEDFTKLYRVDSDKSDSEDEATNEKSEDDITDENSESDESEVKKKKPSEKEMREILRDPSKNFAREVCFSDSSDDDDSSSDDERNDLDSEISESDSANSDLDSEGNDDDVMETRRIAVLNANWEYTKASDLMVIFSSFATVSGTIKKVSIYLSNYGRECISKEDEMGPQLFLNDDETSVSVEYLDQLERGELDNDGTLSDEQLRAFRKYQSKKLKYYYAIVECDSVDTAILIYKQLDKTSIGTLGSSIELQYVTEDTEFDEEPVDSCEGAPSSYEYFGFNECDEKQNSLKWDETDPKRTKVMEEVMKRALKGETIEDDALKDYIGSGSSSEDEEENDLKSMSKQKRKKRLQKIVKIIDTKGDISTDDLATDESCDDSEDDVHMTDTFQVNAKETLISKEEADSDQEEEKNNTENDLQLMLMDETNEDGHFDMRDVLKESKLKRKIGKKKWDKLKIKQKRDRPATEDDFKLNIDDDDRFALIFNGVYNIDQNHPQYKRTPIMDNLVDEIANKRRKYNNGKNDIGGSEL